MTKLNYDELSFEEAMEKLEEIVKKLEEGGVPLEQAIDYYQQGMKLSKLCGEKLSQVQEKMTNILTDEKPLDEQKE